MDHTRSMFSRFHFFPGSYFLYAAILFLAGCLQTTGGTSGTAASPSESGTVVASSSNTPIQGDLGPNGSVTCSTPQNAFQCMMCNCHHETEGESAEGKLAVGKVVMTRVGMSSYPNSVCGVIYQHAQFSWTMSAKKRSERISGASYKNCYPSVTQALRFRGHYASHFHTPRVHPSWARKCKKLGKIGGHIFYESCPGEGRAPAAAQAPEAVAKLDFLEDEGQEESNETKICYR